MELMALRIVTDVGEFEAPREIAAMYVITPIRADGQPDRRTKRGKELAAAFKEFSAAKVQEYMAGRPAKAAVN